MTLRRFTVSTLAALSVCLLSAAAARAQNTSGGLSAAKLRVDDLGTNTVMGVFTELPSMPIETQPAEEEVDEDGVLIRSVPRRKKKPKITLKRNYKHNLNDRVNEWMEQVRDNQAGRKNLRLVMLDANNKVLARFRGENCWPAVIDVKITEGAQYLKEEATFACEVLRRIPLVDSALSDAGAEPDQ